MGQRYSTVFHDRVEYSFWLAFDENGGLTMSRGEPGLGSRDRAMSCTLSVPRTIFQVPQLSATITLQGADVPRPIIDVQAAEEALKEAIGMDITITVRDPS